MSVIERSSYSFCDEEGTAETNASAYLHLQQDQAETNIYEVVQIFAMHRRMFSSWDKFKKEDPALLTLR